MDHLRYDTITIQANKPTFDIYQPTGRHDTTVIEGLNFDNFIMIRDVLCELAGKGIANVVVDMSEIPNHVQMWGVPMLYGYIDAFHMNGQFVGLDYERFMKPGALDERSREFLHQLKPQVHPSIEEAIHAIDPFPSEGKDAVHVAANKSTFGIYCPSNRTDTAVVERVDYHNFENLRDVVQELRGQGIKNLVVDLSSIPPGGRKMHLLILEGMCISQDMEGRYTGVTINDIKRGEEGPLEDAYRQKIFKTIDAAVESIQGA